MRAIHPGQEQTTAFTITIRTAGRTVINSGVSRAGEGWEDVLCRLYNATLPTQEPRRRVAFMTYHSFEVGSSTNMVITASDGALDDERQDAPVFITIDPPQF